MGGTDGLFLLGWAMWLLLLVVAVVDWSEVLFDRFTGRQTPRTTFARACVCTALACSFLGFSSWNKLHLFWLAFIIVIGSIWIERQDVRRRSQRGLQRAHELALSRIPSQRLPAEGGGRPRVSASALRADIKRIVRAHVVLWDVDAETYGVAWTLDDGTQGSDLVGSLSEAESIVHTVSATVVKRLQSFAAAAAPDSVRNTADGS